MGRHSLDGLSWAVLFHLTAWVLVLWVSGADGKALSGRCSLFGQHHIHTFDGVLYDFPGDCSYMLAGDCHRRSFSLLGDFRHGKRRGVTVYLGEFFELRLSVDGSLMQGENRLSLPYASSTIFAGTELGYYKLWSEEFGFEVKIDSSGNINLLLSKHHANRTCGLCANFNGLAEDDYTAQEGFLTESSYDFANSWALREPGKPCKRVSPPSKTCNASRSTAADLISQCDALRNSPSFLRCAHVVDPEAFALLCEEDACHCGEDQACRCQAFLEYARSCAAHGLPLHGWQTHSQCSPSCPAGMQYSECTSPCSTTCQSLNIHEVCREECSDGCTCPAGKILEGVRCVDVSQCSCMHTGRRYPPGSSIPQDCNTCVCRHGSWECTNEGCPGECFVTGQSHFKTFDNKFFTFSGICQYLFAKDCQDNLFAAAIETVQCADDQDAVCTRSATLRFHQLANVTVKLKHGGVVAVDGMDIQTPLSHGPLRIKRTVLSSLRVSYGDDFQLDWDGRGKLLLKLGPAFAGKTCGLCGNYNGNQGDDFLTDAGLVETRVEGFGNSWKMNGDCNNVVKQDTDPCILNPKRVRFAEESCSVVFSVQFEPCHNEVNPAPFLKNCRYDVCACADGQECLCSAVASYAAACASKGVLVNWRSPKFCELSCPDDQAYEQCGSPCNQSCRSLSFPETNCRDLCLEGCYCPRGLFLSEESKECVPRAECPCYYDGEVYHPNDVFSDYHSICYCENGAMRCSSNEMPAAMLSDLFAEDLPASRGRRSVSCTPPMQNLVCASPRDVGIECTKTCQNYDLECVSQGCISGCTCPAGMVRHRRDCITPDQCPCYHNNKAYAPGQTITMDCNTCVCRNRKWECSRNVCDGSCKTVGDAHYITFDGFQYSFPGLCQYVLVQDHCNGDKGTFRVLVENTACGLVGHRCAKSVTVLYHGGLIVMEQGEVKMKRPVLKETEVEIVRSGLYYILLLGKDIVITWDKGTRLVVQIKGHYREKVCGLCGNFDGIQNNDLLSSNNQLEVGAADFGNSWKVNPSCADAVQVPSQCSDNTLKLVTVEQSCRVLTSAIFRECNSVVNPEPYWEICIYDTCSCPSVGDCVCFCDAIAAYAHECAQRGIVVHWRSNDLCPLSCQDLNKAEPEFECEWRYNACASACPITCQHPVPLQCSQECVEGCHAYCPAGKVLDEVAMQCVNPEQCQVCEHEGQRISHGKKIILNHQDPELCQICHCDDNKLTCERCPIEVSTTLAPTTYFTTPTPMPFSTPVPADTCDRAMDLAFLVDGSSALSEEEFEQVKLFILGVVQRFRMGSAHTRATMLLFHSGVKSYEMQVQKWIFRRMVREMKYSGGDLAFMDEAIKYLSVFIYDKDKREHAGRVAIILTASPNPRPMKMTQRLLKKKDITTISIALGPEASVAQINDITKANPSSRAYILSSVEELDVRAVEVIDYLCTLGLEPEVPKPKPIPTKQAPIPTTPGPSIHVTPTQQILRPPVPTTAGLLSTTPSSPWAIKEVTFVVEGSDKVGEVDFNKTRKFLEEAVSELALSEEHIRITIIQYSYTITVEFTQKEAQSRSVLLERIRQIRWRGGQATNTGQAVRTVSQTRSTNVQNSQEQKPQLVFMVTSNPPTDTVQRPSESTNTIIYPIGVGQKIKEVDLESLTFPKKPIMVDSYDNLRSVVKRVVNITRFTTSNIRPLSPTLPPLQPTLAPMTTLPPSVPCQKPMDVIFLLKESSGEGPSQFEDMKAFVKAFINSADIGSKGIQVSVIQYGERNTVDVSWREEQSKENLLSLVDSIKKRGTTASTLGSALRFAVQTTISSVSGGRLGVAKIIVMLVTDRSTDSVVEAVNEASTAGVSVFPIGIGSHYDVTELNALAGRGMQSNVIHMNIIEDLLAMVTLGHAFTDKLCRAGLPGVCVDDDGNQRKPGETWVLSDQCHSLLCHPNGAVTLQSHRVNCEHMERPACKNNLRSVKVPEPCGCRWACPCMCMGSSTNHVVAFDGLTLKLDGFCSYSLLRAEGAGGVEVILHNGPCQASPTQICMKAMEVKVGEVSVVLKDDMRVTIDGIENQAPFRTHGVEVTQYGAVMHQLKVEELGYLVAFTPQSNEFTIQLSPTMVNNRTTGLCGYCDQDEQNDLALPSGSLTKDSEAFIRAWSLPGPDGTACQPRSSAACEHPVTDRCQILRSPVFAPCHAAVPPEAFVALCQQNGCHMGEICDLVSAYGRLCRLQGVCINWRSEDFCPMPCPSSMVFDGCRTGCVEECGGGSSGGGRAPLGDDVTLGDGAPGGGGPLCMDTPTEGCFCPPGKVLHGGVCVSPDACSQCLDQHGKAYQYLETWVPQDKPCQICMCLDKQHINCSARPCTDIKAPECGPCEVLREKRESQCCPEYECVCDLVNCDLPEIPHCVDGLTVTLSNPGQCKPIHECVCKREMCPLLAPPPCPPHRRLAVRKTQCCGVQECVCDCQNSTRTCPPGYITSSVTNDCNCTEVTCIPDKVCVVSGVVYQVGSEWEESCKTCTCTSQQDRITGLHIVQCLDKVCNEICPTGSTYSRPKGECCGKCRKSSCVEQYEGGPLGDMSSGGRLRRVGERWRSSEHRCMISECVQVNDEVFISHSNVSCNQLDAPSCPLGTELHCSTDDCCPNCQCVPLEGCLMNHTVIGVGERVMVDLCTRCQCSMEWGAVRKYRLSCRTINCAPCPEGYSLEPIPDACCGRCIATACRIQRPDGTLVSLRANQTHENGCSFHHCRVNQKGELVLETRITTCPPFNRASCLGAGGKVSQIGDSCCEMCTEPECKKTTGVLNYIKVDDCQSERQLELHYCEGKCRSKSMFSLERNRVEHQCVCCAATATSILTVPLRCTNGTLVQHQVLSVTACDCQSQRCEGE
ncbi:von Willebrand factor isoform X1 [Anguilla rostrata]|uniref:von Willebrand factor isoform X1 n=1 Tax=Anguilla rostrata TaxID=7938 RepID=UPI0030CFFDEE